MKKIIICVAIFLIAFVISYIGLCYLIPGWRIKLAADATTYFIKSIHHMIFLKSVISFVIAAMLASIPFISAKMEGE